MTWAKRRLADVAELSLGKMLDLKKNRGAPRPYLANVNVRWGSFDLSDLREMRFEPHENERYGLRRGDIVMCEGGEPGRCAIWRDQVSGMMLQKALHRVRAKAGLDAEFLFYCLFHQGRSGALEHLFTGATIKHLPGEQLAKVEVPVPPPSTQRRIASILGAYDDLIEVNRRRIALLEEMARRLFEEWFVHFRFPGHESVRMEETPEGPLPEGWHRVILGEVAENFDRLRKPLSKPQRQGMRGPYPYYGAAKIFDHLDSYLFDGLYLLVAEDGSVVTDEGYPVLQLADGRFWVNNHAHVIRGATPVSTEFLYLALARYPVRGHITGAAQPKITQASLNRIPLVIAPAEVMEHFNTKAQDLIGLGLRLGSANDKLAASRDLLLPRLISGDLSVTTAERELEAAA